MKSVYEQIINVSQAKLADLYGNSENNVKWMHDLERCEAISGKQGMPGSKYRMIPKKGNMIFTATVGDRNLPREMSLYLEGKVANVSVKGTFIALSPEKTKMISEEIFELKGIYKFFGFLAKAPITKAHHQHIKDFKTFAESVYPCGKEYGNASVS